MLTHYNNYHGQNQQTRINHKYINHTDTLLLLINRTKPFNDLSSQHHERTIKEIAIGSN